MGFAVVIAGGDVPDNRLLAEFSEAELVVAADAGVRVARTHGLPIHAVIGDLDSASDGDLAWASAEGADVIELPADKDETDLELALEHADSGVDVIVVVGVSGGRLDHELGNWAALCAPRTAVVEARTVSGTATILHGDTCEQRSFEGKPGEVISLIPRLGPVHGVTTSGLRWPLEDATLHPERTRGISNEFEATQSQVSIREGALMVVRPYPTVINPR